MKVIQMTDTHLFGDPDQTLYGLDTLASLQAVVELARRCDPDPSIILLTGDLAHDGSAIAYRNLAVALRDLGAPVYWLPGNHDDPCVAAETLSACGCLSQRRVCLEGWQIILLDSCVLGAVGGHLAQSELDRLTDCLEELQHLPALVCLHHQPVPVGTPWMDAMGLDNASVLFQVLDRYPQVRGLIWGHVHQAYEGVRHGVQLFAAPATSIQFEPGSASLTLHEEGPGYRCLKLVPNGLIETSVRRLEPRVCGSQAR